MLINVQMPTIVHSTFMSMINCSVDLSMKKALEPLDQVSLLHCVIAVRGPSLFRITSFCLWYVIVAFPCHNFLFYLVVACSQFINLD